MLLSIFGKVRSVNAWFVTLRRQQDASRHFLQVPRGLIVSSLAILISVTQFAGAQLQYDRTSFLNGFASDSLIWTRATYELQTSPVSYLGAAIPLGMVRNPNVNKALRYSQHLQAIAPVISAGGEHVLVGHSLGSLVARGLYIHRPETRPHIKGILAIAALHQGAPLADNAQQAVNFFVDVQRRVDDGARAITIQAFVLWVISYYSPDPWRAIFSNIAMFFLQAAQGETFELGDLLNIPKVPAIRDLSPDSSAVQGLARFDDASIPRANVYGTIPFKHAAIRVGLSGRGRDRDFASTVDSFNTGLIAFTACKYIGYATIVLGRTGRACAYARKVMKRVDERWVRYVNGTDGYGRPKYVPFDGVVPNERSRYPTPNALAYDVGVNGVNHQNIYTRQAGLDQVIEGMRRMGMVSGAPPPPPPSTLTASISGPDAVNTDWYSTWGAEVSGGTPPYTYSWSGLFYGSSSSISGTTATSGDLILDVYDAAGGHATATKFVTSTGCSGPELC
jgi:pimeloyl-ACP methyl ester carboxylesterase